MESTATGAYTRPQQIWLCGQPQIGCISRCPPRNGLIYFSRNIGDERGTYYPGEAGRPAPATDGLTPSYAVIRNALSDGTTINVHSAVWHVIKPRLLPPASSTGPSACGSMAPTTGFAFRWRPRMPTLNAILLDYGHASVQPTVHRQYRWLALTLFVLLALAAVALAIVVATVGCMMPPPISSGA